MVEVGDSNSPATTRQNKSPLLRVFFCLLIGLNSLAPQGGANVFRKASLYVSGTEAICDCDLEIRRAQLAVPNVSPEGINGPERVRA